MEDFGVIVFVAVELNAFRVPNVADKTNTFQSTRDDDERIVGVMACDCQNLSHLKSLPTFACTMNFLELCCSPCSSIKCIALLLKPTVSS